MNDNQAELVKVLDNFFANSDILEEELAMLVQCLSRPENKELAATEKEKIIKAAFAELVDYWMIAAKGSKQCAIIEKYFVNFLIEYAATIEKLLQFSKQLDYGSALEEVLIKRLEKLLDEQQIDDVEEWEKYQQLTALGSGTEAFLEKRKLAFIKETKKIEAIDPTDIDHLPPWFWKLLQSPSTIPASWKLSVMRKAREIRLHLKKSEQELRENFFSLSDHLDG